jgi:hypothetical protein
VVYKRSLRLDYILSMQNDEPPERRDKARPVKVYLTPTERGELEKKAFTTGLPLAVFLRNVGLGTPVTSVLDLEAVLSLLKVNADQGRLGGLLKLCLSGPAPAAPPGELRRLLHEIESAQKVLRGIIDRL